MSKLSKQILYNVNTHMNAVNGINNVHYNILQNLLVCFASVFTLDTIENKTMAIYIQCTFTRMRFCPYIQCNLR